jgi:hypothetical protein
MLFNDVFQYKNYTASEYMRRYVGVHCDTMPESRSSGATEDVHC